MGFFKNLLSSRNTAALQPEIQFGRYSDSYKSDIKYDIWDQALSLFEDGEYLEAYRLFFNYLTDDEIENVTTSERNGVIFYSFYQGSKLITGEADQNHFTAEAKVASFSEKNIGVFRKLLEDNFHLKYSKYAIDKENNIALIFQTSSLDGSPYKLYYALKELSTIADKTDDVLIDKYSDLEAINTHHVRALSDKEKRTKYEYFRSAIKEVVDTVNNTKLDLDKHPGALSYLYLDLIFRLDYLLKPEGYMMESIAKINHLYFKDKVRTIEQKNQKMWRRIDELSKLSFEAFSKELYEIKSTFGITSPSSQNSIRDFIRGELSNMDWYYDEGYEAVSLAIPSYIVGYSFFNYAMPTPLREMLQIFYRVSEYPYFKSLGYQEKLVSDDKVLNKKLINKAIRDICNEAREMYPALLPNLKSLQFSNIHMFAKSYLVLVGSLDFTRADKR